MPQRRADCQWAGKLATVLRISSGLRVPVIEQEKKIASRAERAEAIPGGGVDPAGPLPP